MRPADLTQDPLDVGDGVDAHGLGHVGAGFHEQLAAGDGRLETLDARGIGARRDEQVAVAPRIERGFDLGEHLLDRDDLLAWQVAAAIWKNLIADEQAGDPRRFEGAHHLLHVVDAAEAGVGVDIDRHLDGGANTRVVVA